MIEIKQKDLRSSTADTQLERTVLAYCLSGSHFEVFEIIKDKKAFTNLAHESLFSVLSLIESENKPIDLLNITRIGGSETAILANSLKNEQKIGEVKSCCLRLIELYIGRLTYNSCQAIMESISKDPTGQGNVMASFQMSMAGAEIAEMMNTIKEITFQELKKDVLIDIKQRVLGNCESVIKTYIHVLDDATGGYEPGTLHIIAARPAMGKTAVAVQIAYNNAILGNNKVAIFNLEMTKEQLMKRFLSLHTSTSNLEIKKGFYQNENSFNEFQAKTETLITNDITLIDTTFYLEDIKNKAKFLAKNGVKLIIIDYLQLIKTRAAKGNRENEVSTISRDLKLLSKDLKIPIIALSQLSRAVETRGGDKKPNLSDLRESGSIEQDADSVSFLYRPEYYNILNYDDGSSTAGILEIIIAKQRDGRTLTVKVKYELRYNQIEHNIGLVHRSEDDVIEQSFQKKLDVSGGVNFFESLATTTQNKPIDF